MCSNGDLEAPDVPHLHTDLGGDVIVKPTWQGGECLLCGEELKARKIPPSVAAAFRLSGVTGVRELVNARPPRTRYEHGLKERMRLYDVWSNRAASIEMAYSPNTSR